MTKKIIKLDKTPRRIRTRHQIAENNNRPRIITGERVGVTKVFSTDNYHRDVIDWINSEVANCIRSNDLKFVKVEGKTTKMRHRLTKESLCSAIRKTKTLKLIDAKFEDLYPCKDTLVKLPPDNDLCLQLCQEHYCAIPVDADLEQNPEIIFVPQHWRRSLSFGNAKVNRNFYMQEESLLGKTVVADIGIQLKTNLSTGEQNIVLNYQNIRPSTACRALRSMKIGTTQGQIPIPGTDKFIQVDWIKKPGRAKAIA